MPAPEKTKAYRRPGLVEKVEECMTMVDSGHESRAHWDFLQKINDILMKKPSLTKPQALLLKKIQPLMKRWGRMTGAEQDSDRLAEIEELV